MPSQLKIFDAIFFAPAMFAGATTRLCQMYGSARVPISGSKAGLEIRSC